MATICSNQAVLEHVYDELDISPKNREILYNVASIKTVDDLLRKRRQLRQGQLRGVRSLMQEVLFNFVCWFKSFEKEHKREPDLEFEFKEATYVNFIKDTKKIEEIVRLMDIELIEDGNLPLGEALFQLYTEGDSAFHDIIANREKRTALVDFIAEEVQCNLSDVLKEKCYFEIDKAVEMGIESLLGAPREGVQQVQPILVYGQTQSGKSAFKAVQIAVCSFMRVPLVVVTKDKTESEELFQKQLAFAAGTSVESTIFSPYGTSEADIQDHFNNGMGGCVIVPDNGSKLEMAVRLISRYKVHREAQHKDEKTALIEDECDASYRTINSSQRMEKALGRLRHFGPSLHMLISATPNPVLLLYKEEYKKELEMFNIGTSDDYVGVESMKPLCDTNNNVVFLDHKLSHDSGDNIEFAIIPTYDEQGPDKLFAEDESVDRFCSDAKKGTTIPCADAKVKLLYDTALATQDENAKGILVLDCTLSRVNVEGNKFQKAARLQELYRHKGKDIIVIVYTGRGVSYRLPGQRTGFSCARKRKIGDVMEKIDASANYGLDMPIFVFGYSKMRRVISYRSSLRVPTHIVMYLGMGHSVENFIQALGRATFNGKSVLEQNGHSHVTYLMPGHDANIAPAYDSFVKEIHRRCMNGDSLNQAMSGANGKLPDKTNYLRLTNRKTGQRPKRDDIGRYHDRDSFEEPPEELDVTEKQRKDKYWHNLVAQRILRILCDDKKNDYSTEDIRDAYNDRYRDDSENASLSKTRANKILTALKNDALVRKIENIKKEVHIWWKVEHPLRIRKSFLNQELIRTEAQKCRRAERKRRQESQDAQAQRAKKPRPAKDPARSLFG